MRTYTTPRTKTRQTLRVAAGLAVIAAAIIGTLVYQSASSTALSFGEVLLSDHGGMTTDDRGATGRPGAPPHRGGDHGDATTEDAVTEDDGVLPDGVTVFEDTYPGVANLDPALLQTLRAAATDAADDDIGFYITSGWRSPAYQNQLLQEAVAEYGSEAEAARWVATADTSAHVSGNAVDLGPEGAIAWLSQHGSEYGLCQVYDNEPWHFELNLQAIDLGCPPTFADPTQDPRMQQ
jgi:hypothetical protein